MNFFVDDKRNLLIYEGTPVPALLESIADLRVEGRWFIVSRTLRNCQILRHWNYPVPPVMTRDNYDWPIEPGKNPLEHQLVYANFMALHPRGFNLGDPGTMKTLSTAWAMDWIMNQNPGMKALVVAPLTVLDTVWGNVWKRNFLGRRSCEILIGDETRRLRLLKSNVDVYIVNFDGIKVGCKFNRRSRPGQRRIELDGFSAELARREDIRMVVVDEASAFSDATTDRHHVARQVLGRRDYFWQLTGSPTPNKPTDAYGLAKLANNAFGKSFQAFQMETMFKVSQFKWVPQKDGYDKARRLLTPSVRYRIEDVWDGPPMTVQRRQVELTAEQRKHFATLKSEMQILARNGARIDVANEASLRTKLIQIAMGAVYDEKHAAHPIDAEPRFKEIEEIIENTDRKVLIFVPITSVLHLLRKRFVKRWKSHYINGEISAGKRPEIINTFAEDDSKIMLVDPGATAHGINEFVVCDTAIWFGPTDKAELWVQGNKRVHRPGQKYPTTIYQIVSTRTEAEIFDRLENNTTLQGLMLEAVRRGDF